MKNISNKIKVLAIICAIIIIAGIIVVAVKGFNFDLEYSEMKRVEFYLEKSFNKADIKQITDEVLENQNVIIQKVEVYGNTVGILAKDINEEQKNNLVTKLNEKYELELSAEDVEINVVPHVKGRDIFEPYIMPFAIATVIILAYLFIRYFKLGAIKVLLQSIGITLLTQVLLFSIIAITRIPVGRLTMPMIITVYILTLVGITSKFEKKLGEHKEKNK